MRKDRIKSRWEGEQECDKCEFFGGAIKGGTSGKCQRFPPNVMPVGEAVIKFLDVRERYLLEDAQPDTPVRINSESPVVSIYDWCGEFKHKHSFKLTNMVTFSKKLTEKTHASE